MPDTKNTKQSFREILEKLNLAPIWVNFSRQRAPIRNRTSSFSLKSFQQELLKVGSRELSTVGLLDLILPHGLDRLQNLLTEVADDENTNTRDITIPELYRDMTLYLDVSHTGRELKFFLADSSYEILPISGSVYMRSCGMDETTAIELATHVTPYYDPLSPRGVSDLEVSGKITTAGFNKYIPPKWKAYMSKVKETKCPQVIAKLVEHVLPIPIEQEFFYRWIRRSLRGRAPTFLVLCGLAGVGKNRLNLLMSSLHGHTNRVAGKKTTLAGSFNWQLADCTLVWFDELSYSAQLENTMKELPNDQISLERKGVDATRSTKLYGSYVISNNKLRDNYFAFDARKFAALVLNTSRLETAMRPQTISKLSKKIDEASPEYDPLILAQFVTWLESLPEDDELLFPNMEYKGPMFWRIAYASMSRWQKVTVETLLTSPRGGKPNGNMVGLSQLDYEKGKGFLWSRVEKVMQKKKGKGSDAMADYSTVKYFLDKFRDGSGNEIFKTIAVDGDAMGDFYVKVTNEEVKIISETDIEGLKAEGEKVEARIREEAEVRRKSEEYFAKQNAKRRPTKSSRGDKEMENIRRSKKRDRDVSGDPQRRTKSRFRRREVSASR